jgi:hypothetical protein
MAALRKQAMTSLVKLAQPGLLRSIGHYRSEKWWIMMNVRYDTACAIEAADIWPACTDTIKSRRLPHYSSFSRFCLTPHYYPQCRTTARLFIINLHGLALWQHREPTLPIEERVARRAASLRPLVMARMLLLGMGPSPRPLLAQRLPTPRSTLLPTLRQGHRVSCRE